MRLLDHLSEINGEQSGADRRPRPQDRWLARLDLDNRGFSA